MRAVVESLGGVSADARFITGTGGETLPAGIDPKTVIVERSVPISTLGDALLAWEMNGEPVPHAHGGPLRLIIPGYSGVNNIKYIKRLAFTRDQTDAAIQATRYRIAPPGTKESPALPAVWEMDPNRGSIRPLRKPGRSVAAGYRSMAWRWAACRRRAGRRVARRRQDVARSKFYRPNLGRYAWRPCAASRVEAGNACWPRALRIRKAGSRSKPPRQCRRLFEQRLACSRDPGHCRLTRM